MTDRLDVWFHVPREVDPAGWAERHARGEVPDRLPYGIDRLEAEGCEVRVPAAPAGGLLGLAAKVSARALADLDLAGPRRDAAARRACDVALAWDERVGVGAALAGRGSAEPPVATGVIWATEGRSSASRRRVLRAGLGRAAAVWALSEAQLPVLTEALGVARGRCHFLPFGIDTDFFTAPAGQRDEVVLAVGNDQHRDHATVLRAMAEVRRHRPDARLELVTSQAVDVPAELGRRLEHVPHHALRDRYGAVRVMALACTPNLHVSGMTALLEAAACGVPVVATRTPGIEAYVRDGETGVLVPPGDDAAMAGALADLLADADRCAALGATAQAFVRAERSTRAQASRLAEILRAAA